MTSKDYFKRVFISILLNLAWAFASTWLEYLVKPDSDNPIGLITGAGYILIYAISYLLFLPQKQRTSGALLQLYIFLIFIFIAATFIPAVIFLELNEYLFLFFSSLLGSFAIVFLVSFFLKIQQKWFTILLHTIIMWVVAIIFFGISDSNWIETMDSKRIIHPIALGYTIWQSISIIIIGRVFLKASWFENKNIPGLVAMPVSDRR